ncbi:MAG: hypothetical protein IJL21_01060 [Alphaproteobacteria bacterium]|nr:hypothetical protein [Alphaproteobacteria bacterium]
MALSLKNKLFDYFAQRHFDLMPPEVRARFDEYAKNGDFQGHMKHWNDNYKDKLLPDLLSGTVCGVANEYQLSPTEWEELFDAFQETFQDMDSAKEPSVGFESPYKAATKDFIAKWFGDSSKTFTTTTATSDTNTAFSNLGTWLATNRASLTVPFKHNLSDIFTDGYTYDKLISDIGTKKYDTDLTVRKKLAQVVEFVDYYQKYPDPSILPILVGTGGAGIPPVDLSMLDPDSKKWYSIRNKSYHINRFKGDFSEIFDTLLTKSSVRSDFLSKAQSTISQPLTEAIKSTDYRNKDSKDYVPEKYPDEKTWVQELEDWKNDTYENHLRRFTNPSRGTRLFFSPWSQNIIKAFDKVKIKPTDGLEGILSKKSDILSKLQSSKTSTDHFNWFIDTIEKLKGTMPKAVEGALRNGGQMNQLVSGLIAEAVKQGKTKEAKTALEILSVAKYGLSTSRTLNNLKEDKDLFNVFSNKDLSWNKNEGVKFVTGAIDKTVRAGVLGVGLAITGARNLISHSRTKIGHDISKNKILNDAHKKWEAEDAQKLANAKDSNTRLAVELKLSTLASGGGLSGLVVDETTIGDESTPGTIKYELKNALSTGATTVTVGTTTVSVSNLQDDVELYDDSKKRHNIVANWASDRKDPYEELIAYWNMLEKTGMTHAFTLGSMAIKRKDILKNYGNKVTPSLAETKASGYLAQFRSQGPLRTA